MIGTLPMWYLATAQTPKATRRCRGGKPKLTAAQVREIRANKTDKDEVLALQYGISPGYAGLVRRGETHTRIP